MAEKFIFTGEKHLIIAIRKDKTLFPRLPKKYRTQKIQKIAVEADWNALQYIEKPSKLVQLAAVNKNASAIKYLKYPDESVLVIALQKNWHVAKYVQDETILQHAAMKNVELIRFINEPSESLQLAVVSQRADLVRYIKNPTQKVKMLAVNTNPQLIKYFKNPERDVQMAAVKKDETCASLIDNPCMELQTYLHSKELSRCTMSQSALKDYIRQYQEKMAARGL